MLGELSSCSTWASLGVARGLSRPVACRILVLQPEIKPESAVLQGGFLTTGPPRKSPKRSFLTMLHKTASQPLLLLLSHFRRVRLCVTPQTAAHQAPPSLGFSRQEPWSGLPFPSPMHESEKWKWSRSIVSNFSRPHGLQPTRLLSPWDFLGKGTEVGCHCLLPQPLLLPS